ncbi:MAG: hypothetical protein R3E01_23005 [Pirellulaceae bacterium]|nr:hypothetical protein [Planctomycetales bacterium]
MRDNEIGTLIVDRCIKTFGLNCWKRCAKGRSPCDDLAPPEAGEWRNAFGEAPCLWEDFFKTKDGWDSRGTLTAGTAAGL